MATNQPPPAERASELIEKLPSSPNLITKTGTALLAAGAAATAISQELYVVNEESIVFLASLIVFTYIGKVGHSRFESLQNLISVTGHSRALRFMGPRTRRPHQESSQRSSC